MRIARIIEYFPPHLGGMERHGLILSQEQVKLGHEVDVFIGYGGNLPKSNFTKSDFKNFPKSDFKFKLDFGIYKMPLQFLPLYSKARRFWFNFWACNKVKKIHKKNPFDIIHLHGDFVEAFFGGKLSKKLGIPAVLTIHAGLNKRHLKPKNAAYFQNIGKIICVSNEIAGDLEKVGVPKEKIAVISSGAYLKEFNKPDKGEISDIRDAHTKPILISVGVLRISKGFNYLIDAYKVVKQKVPSAALIIIGDGPEKNNLLVQAKNISDIYFLGRQSHDKIIKYLKAADIFVLPSIDMPQDREGTPTSIMEAMAAGLPIVTTKTGGIPYLIKEWENGLLVEERNPEALAGAIIKLLEDKNLAQQMREKNLEDIKQKDWPIIAKFVNEVYESVL